MSTTTTVQAHLMLADVLCKAYKLAGKTTFRGLPISIETKKGQIRKGISADGKPWEVTMPEDYGYIRGTKGADDQHVDCFIGPNKDAEEVYVIHQCKEDNPKEYDEDKVMLGFSSLEDAIKAYKSAYVGVDLFKGSHTFNFGDFVEAIHQDSNKGKSLECEEDIEDWEQQEEEEEIARQALSDQELNYALEDEEEGTEHRENLQHDLDKLNKIIHAGGPGSGWFSDNGHVGTVHMPAADLHEHLQSLSKHPLPGFVKQATKMLEEAGLDKRYFESRQMTKFRTADKLAIHPLAIANYNQSHRYLEFRNDAGKDDVTHELAHHLDLTFVRQPDKEEGDKVSINKAYAQKLVDAYTSEWHAAKEKMQDALGHRFRFSNDYQKLESKPELQKDIPTLYALDGPKEWFAESFSQYVKGGKYRDRLERVAPKTAAAVKAVITGRIFE